MTKLEELEQDLATHKASLKELQDPNFRSKAYRGRIYNPRYDVNPAVIIPSYKKIIKSIEDEITEINGKKIKSTKAQTKAPAKKSAPVSKSGKAKPKAGKSN